MIKKRALFLSLFLLFFLSAAAALFFSWRGQFEYDYLYYEGNYYIVKNEAVSPEQIGEKCGEVQRQIGHAILGENQSLDSNCLPVGTPVYRILGEHSEPEKNLVVWWREEYRKLYLIYDDFPNQ